MFESLRVKKLLKNFGSRIIIFNSLILSPFLVEAKVSLPAFFSSNMVLQQKAQVPLWGWDAPDKEIRIVTSWDKKNYTVRADASGKWKVQVATPSYGGPYSITFDDGAPLTLDNILIGEVWICSGQSNMEMPLEGWGKIKNYKEEIAEASWPKIRLLQVEKAASVKPLDTIKAEGGGWQVCSPATIPGFSSVAYFFARNVFESTHIPVGVIHTSWGGTIAEAWTSGASLKTMPEFKSIVGKMETDANYEKNEQAKYDRDFEVWNKEVLTKDAGYSSGSPVWAQPSANVSDWKTMQLPVLWEQAGLDGFDGIVWFRKTVSLPADWAGKDLTVSLGPVDDNDITWFNGDEIGRTEGWDKPRTYTIPGKLVKAGENVLTVRVFDGSGGGGIYGSPEALYLKNASGEKINITGSWNYKAAVNLKEIPPAPVSNTTGPNRPTVLYNAMIHPLVPYAFRGVIWYQGESNASRAYQYRQLFPLMITDWRRNWNNGDFPFYFVQLANYMKRDDQPSESEWAELREAQKMTLSLPNTGMAVAIDIGEENDIHPKNKQEVGRRLALIALSNIYGQKASWSGPLYKSYKKDGNQIRISFTHTAPGLKAKDGALKGFAIAGADHKFHWAKAVISGDEVLVSSPEVPDPVAVRYGWANNPDCNLYNGADLPASPFRTDNWQGITFGKK